MRKIFTSLAAMCVLTGCATIMTGSSQDIHFKVVDYKSKQILSGTHCTITDSHHNSYQLIKNPGVVQISKGMGSTVVQCTKPGYSQLNMLVGDSFNALTIVNVLFWPGFIIDAVSGAYKKYPTHYVVEMKKNS